MPSLPDSFITHVEVAAQEIEYKNLRVGKEQYDGVYKAGILDYRLGEDVTDFVF